MTIESGPSRLRDVAMLVRGVSYRSSELSDDPGAAAFFNLKCVARGGGYRPEGLKFFRGRIRPEQHLRPGDLLMAVTDLTQACDVVGCPIVVPDPLPRSEATYSLDLVKVVPDSSLVVPDYLAYLLRSPYARAFMRSRLTGTTVLHLSPDAAGELEWELPSLEQQRRIASVLGALDDLIDVNDRLVALVRQVSHAKYENLVRDPIEALIGEVAVVNADQTRKQASGGLTYLDIGSVGDGVAELDTRMDWREAPSRARRLAQHGDTVWSMVRPNRRAHALLLDPPENLVVSTGIAVLRPTAVGPATLFAAVDRQKFVDHLVSNAQGSAYPAVKASTFESAPIALPQSRDRRDFERSLWPLWEWVGSLFKENELLRSTREELLPLLLSGRVLPGEVAA